MSCFVSGVQWLSRQTSASRAAIVSASCLHSSGYSETDESVTITVHVGVNQRFFLWVMSYGDGIELLSPAKTRSEYLAEVRKMLGAYPES
ncbi:WYL domain-containing protein [Ruminococcus albus]|uniref:WYL domain-containing protein n=1 Tax=Ruminococcus albus TaxID=1264 RepID=UPI00325BDE0A